MAGSASREIKTKKNPAMLSLVMKRKGQGRVNSAGLGEAPIKEILISKSHKILPQTVTNTAQMKMLKGVF